MKTEKKEKLPKVKLSPYARVILWLAACISAICGGLYGYDTGIISGALLLINRDFHLTGTQEEMVASAILLGAMAGALATSWFSEHFGRRASIIGVTAIFVIGAVECGNAQTFDALIAWRLFLGVAVGGSTQVVPTYIAELAPASKRGNLVTFFNVAIGIGIFLANLVSYTKSDVWGWRTMVSIAAIPAFIVFISMFFLPKSPRWAAENEGLHSAIEQLQQVRTSRKTIRREIKKIQLSSPNDDQQTGFRALLQPWVRPALIAALGVAFFTQAGGLEMMIYYTPTFLTDAGFGHQWALMTSLGAAIIYLVMTLLGSLLVDHIGRRRLVLFMAPGTVISLFGLGTLFVIGAHNTLTHWLVISFVLLFMMFNSGSIQVVGWLLGAELFPLSMRTAATALYATVLWGANFFVTSTALTLVHLISLGGTMWLYGLVNFASIIFFWYFVPETNGASLEDIEQALHKGQFKPSKANHYSIPDYDG